MSPESFSLYLHIPFCKKKCPYCHFYVIPEKDPLKDQLLTAFIQEWQSWLPQIEGKTLETIYFGGGTPSLFEPRRIERFLNLVRKTFSIEDCEITLEGNPDELSKSLLQNYSNAGINRLSIGVQSFEDNLLQTLGRNHSANQAARSVVDATQAGIHNISIDLMYDLPGQTLQDFNQSLEAATDLPITHLSLYNLTFEPGTVFYKQQQSLSPLLPKEHTSLEMVQEARNQLFKAGLQQYEISAFSKKGFPSRHNIGYWKGRPFLGFGPSAHSFWEGLRYRNVPHLKQYCDAIENNRSPVDEEDPLSAEDRRNELFAVQIRLFEGIEIDEFQKKWGPLSQSTMKSISELSLNGFIHFENNHAQLTERGILFYDSVAEKLI